MSISFFINGLEFFLIYGWVILGPVLPSIIAAVLSYFAFNPESKFFYHNLNAASILTTLLALYVAYEVGFGAASKDAQSGVALVLLPIWTPFVFVISFLVSAAFYSIFRDGLLDIKKVYLNKFDRLTFFISSFLILIYILFLLIILTR